MDEQDLQDSRDMKLKEAEKTIANKDVIINMLQQQVKKLQESFRNKLDETESYRNRFCLANEQIKKLRCKRNPVKHTDQILNLNCEDHEPTPCSEHCPLRVQIPCNYLPQIKNIENFMKAYYDLLQTLTAKLANYEQEPTIRDELSRQYLEQINKLKKEIQYLKEENARLQAGPSYRATSEPDTGLKAKDSFIDAYKRSAHVLQRKISTLIDKEPSLILELENDEDKLPIVEDDTSKKISFGPSGAARKPSKSLLKPESSISINRSRRSASQVHITTATIIPDTESYEMAVKDMTEDQTGEPYDFYTEDEAFSETNSQFSKKDHSGGKAPCICKSQERLLARQKLFGENLTLSDQEDDLSLQSHCSCGGETSESSDSRSPSPGPKKPVKIEEKDSRPVKIEERESQPKKSSFQLEPDKNQAIQMLKEVKDDTDITGQSDYRQGLFQKNNTHNSEIFKKPSRSEDQVNRTSSQKNFVKILEDNVKARETSLDVGDQKKTQKSLCNCEVQTNSDTSSLKPCSCSRRQSTQSKEEGSKLQNKRVSLNMEDEAPSSTHHMCHCGVQTNEAGPSRKPSCLKCACPPKDNISKPEIEPMQQNQAHIYGPDIHTSQEAGPSENQNQNLVCSCDPDQEPLKPCSCETDDNDDYEDSRNQRPKSLCFCEGPTGRETCCCKPTNQNLPSKEHLIKTHALENTSSIGIQCVCPKTPTESETLLLQESDAPRVNIRKIPSVTIVEDGKRASSDKTERIRRASFDITPDRTRRVSTDRSADKIGRVPSDRSADKIRRVSSNKSVEKMKKVPSDNAETVKNAEQMRRVSSNKSVEKVKKVPDKVEEIPRFSLNTQSESVGSHKRFLETKLEEIKMIIRELYEAQNSAQDDLNLLREEILTVNDCCKVCNDKISKLAEFVVYQKDSTRETFDDPKDRVDELVRKNNQIQQDIQNLNSKVDILIKVSQTEGVNKNRFARNEDFENDGYESMVQYRRSPLRMDEACCSCEPQNEVTVCVDNIGSENLKLKSSSSVLEQLNSKINKIKCVLVKKSSLDCCCSPGQSDFGNNPGPSTELEIEDIYNTVRNTFMPENQDESRSRLTCCCSENAVGRMGSFTCCRGNPSECLEKFLNISCSHSKVGRDNCDPCKEDFLYNLETYIQYLHDQLNIISCVEDKIDELKNQIKNP